MTADLLLGSIWWGSLCLALLSVLGMLMLIARRLVLMRRERRHGQWRGALLQGIVGYLDGTDDKAVVEVAAQGHLDVVAELIAEMRQVVRGDNRERLTDLAAALGVIDFNRRRLIEGDVRARRLAAAWLAIGPAVRVAVALEAALEDRDYQVRLAAARSLAELRAVRSVRLLVEKLGIEAEHNSRVLYFVFRQLVPALNDQLVALLDSDQPVVIKELALDALAKSGDGTLVEPIARLVDDPSPEIRADALRALAELGYPEAGPCALGALADPSWLVRMQAASCVGRIGFLAAIPRLAELLADEQWWVRYRAAEALYEFGEKGWEVLRSAAAETAGDAARVSELLLAEKEQGGLITDIFDLGDFDLFDLLAMLQPVAEITAWLVIGQGLLQSLIYLVQLLLAYRALRHGPPVKRGSDLWWDYGDIVMPIALLVPAYNEEATIGESVRSLLTLQYPNFEVIVINDGSKDNTLDALIAAFDLKPMVRPYDRSVAHRPIQNMYGSPRHSNLMVIDKENGGKSDALNAGINVSRAPLFCAVDADSLLEPDSLLRAVQPFVDDPYRVVAVGGTVRIVNGCEVRSGRVIRTGLPRRILPLFQTIEYLRAFLMARLAWSELDALTIISGAFGIFRRSVAVAVGGYTHGTVGEDLEIVIKIHRWMKEHGQRYRIRFIPEPVCWTEAPESLRVLARQRMRWQRGALQTIFRHRDMILNRHYGRVGMLGLGNALITDVLGPPFEVIGYLLVPLFWATGALSVEFFIAFLALTFVFGISISVGSLLLEELELRRFPRARDLFILTLAAIVENFGYRQLNNFWRVGGFIQWLRGTQGWGAMKRRGFKKS